METVCHKQLIFESLFSKEVVADFAGGRITSDAGGLLLRELDQRYRLAEKAAARLLCAKSRLSRCCGIRLESKPVSYSCQSRQRYPWRHARSGCTIP